MAKKMKPRADDRYQGKLLVGVINGKKQYKYVYGESQKEVKDKLAALRVELGCGVDLTQKRTLSFWIDRWIRKAEQEQTPEWHSQCKFRAEYWKQRLGAADLSKINTADLEQVLFDLARENPRTCKPSSRKTLIEYKDVIQRIFAYALANRVITFDPSAYITLAPGGPKRPRSAITDEQILRIRQTPGEQQLPALIMIYAGLRLGEVCALTWSDVDLEARTITVNKSLNFRSRSIKSPKTAAGIRTVPIPQILLDALKSAPRSALLVCPHNGAPYTIGTWNHYWEQYCAALGFTTTAHCLRHTYATILYEADVDVLTAKDLMGHSDIATTMKIYTHLREQQKAKSVTKLDAYLMSDKPDLAAK